MFYQGVGGVKRGPDGEDLDCQYWIKQLVQQLVDRTVFHVSAADIIRMADQRL
jgi:hypothetical protein